MKIEAIPMNGQSAPNKNKFYIVAAVLIFIQALVLYMIMKTPVTGFSQNIIKTFIFTFLTISPFYSLLVLFRVVKKSERLLTLKQILVFVLFSLGFFIFTFVSDLALVSLDADIEKIPSNVVCFLIIIIYFICQHVFLVRKHRKQKVALRS